MQANQTSQSSLPSCDLFCNINSASVIGLGETGQSCLRYLKDKKIDLVAMDSRQRPGDLNQLEFDYPQVEFVTGKFDAQRLIESDLIVLSPGISRSTAEISLADEAGVPIIGDIELFAHEIDRSSVIAITGSNGKSTVTALCGELLKTAGFNAKIGGNFGYPALDLLNSPADVYALELSSFQLESTYSLKPTVAVILNISPDHLDKYSSIEKYKAAKQRVFKNAEAIVYNRDDKQSYPKNHSAEKIISFGLGEPVDSEDFGIREISKRDWLCQGEHSLLAVSELPIKGQHNQLNALAALALVYLVGANLKNAVPGLLKFKGLPHRFEYVGQWKGVEWINDSKGTNPGATLASINGQAKEIVLIIGGDAKGADFSVLTPVIQQHVKAIVLFGRDAGLVEEILPPTLPRSYASDLSQAIQIADDFSCENNIVLFSPACASFDMYQNYMQRGDVFKHKVKEYFQ